MKLSCNAPVPADLEARRQSCIPQLPAECVDQPENKEGLSWGWIPLPWELSRQSASP